jgi:hypothetical protein
VHFYSPSATFKKIDGLVLDIDGIYDISVLDIDGIYDISVLDIDGIYDSSVLDIDGIYDGLLKCHIYHLCQVLSCHIYHLCQAGVLRLFHVGLFHTVAPLYNSLRNDVLIVNRCVCIILVFVNKQAFWRWRFPNMGIEGVELRKTDKRQKSYIKAVSRRFASYSCSPL